MKKFFYILLLAVISMTTVSCDERSTIWDTPPYHVSALVGSWESYYMFDGYREYNIYNEMRYDFFNNQTGLFRSYDYAIDFEWEVSDGIITMWFSNGRCESWYYDFDGNCMILSPSPFFDYYEVYHPYGFFYEQKKDIDTTQTRHLNAASGERTMRATMQNNEASPVQQLSASLGSTSEKK